VTFATHLALAFTVSLYWLWLVWFFTFRLRIAATPVTTHGLLHAALRHVLPFSHTVRVLRFTFAHTFSSCPRSFFAVTRFGFHWFPRYTVLPSAVHLAFCVPFFRLPFAHRLTADALPATLYRTHVCGLHDTHAPAFYWLFAVPSVTHPRTHTTCAFTYGLVWLFTFTLPRRTVYPVYVYAAAHTGSFVYSRTLHWTRVAFACRTPLHLCSLRVRYTPLGLLAQLVCSYVLVWLHIHTVPSGLVV